MCAVEHSFGGQWTEEKLKRVREYLEAYMAALKNQPFKLLYIDAFAGTGYRKEKPKEEQKASQGILFPRLAEQDSKEFRDGSAKIALRINRPFDEYIFVEQDPEFAAGLEALKQEFPLLADKIGIENEEANTFIQSLCANKDYWRNRRAVIFLDPYGMQVSWKTISAISGTKAIDLWILFPLGMAISRMLPADGVMPPGWEKALDDFMGTSEWRTKFYKKSETLDLFANQDTVERDADYDAIGQFFVDRLSSVFEGVAPKPLPLFNSRGVPLYLLCFAASNPNGASITVRIAKHILKRS